MTIKAGDLVMVVRPTPCCDNKDLIGTVFVAGNVVPRQLWSCCICRRSRFATSVFIRHDELVDVARIKKIDPISDPEETPASVEREEKTRSPVRA